MRKNKFVLFLRRLGKIVRLSLIDPVCPLCGEPCETGEVCEKCDNALDNAGLESNLYEYLRTASDGSNSKHLYTGVFHYHDYEVKKLIFRLKKTYNRDIFDYCAMKMQDVVRVLNPRDKKFLYVNVPRSNHGKREYGFDQGSILAKALAENFHNARHISLVKRRFWSFKQQKTLTAEKRFDNLNKVFYIPFYYKIFARLALKELCGIIIIDDVMTTGASFLHCADCLAELFPKIPIYGAFLAKT